LFIKLLKSIVFVKLLDPDPDRKFRICQKKARLISDSNPQHWLQRERLLLKTLGATQLVALLNSVAEPEPFLAAPAPTFQKVSAPAPNPAQVLGAICYIFFFFKIDFSEDICYIFFSLKLTSLKI
jgi:hypothetical protein